MRLASMLYAAAVILFGSTQCCGDAGGLDGLEWFNLKLQAHRDDEDGAVAVLLDLHSGGAAPLLEVGADCNTNTLRVS